MMAYACCCGARRGGCDERRRRDAPAGRPRCVLLRASFAVVLPAARCSRCSSSPPAACGRRAAARWTAWANLVADDATLPSAIVASLAAGRAHRRADAGAAGADDDLGAAAGAAGCAAGRVPLPAAADHPGARARGRARATSTRGSTYLLGDSPLTLTFVYVVLVLPYAYRAIDAGAVGDRRRDPGRGRPLAWAPAGPP